MSLRVAVRDRLFASDAFRGALPGGIYPLSDDDPSWMGPQSYPAAFDEFGDIKACCLVRDDGSFAFGPRGARAQQSVVTLLFWQQRGRRDIEAAMRIARVWLDGARPTVGGLYVYELIHAGDGTPTTDPALAEAEHGWSRWQGATVTKG